MLKPFSGEKIVPSHQVTSQSLTRQIPNPTLLLLQTVGPARVRVLVAGIAAVVVAVAQLALVDAADAGAQRALEVIESARVLRCNAATTDTELLIAA